MKLSLKVALAGSAACALSATVPGAAWAASPAVVEQYTQPVGGPYTSTSIVLPGDVCAVDFTIVGAGGGAGLQGEPGLGAPLGGAGATVAGTMAVAPGSTIYITVGGAGIDATNTQAGAGGFNGGGAGGASSGGGGGASDLRLGGTSLTDRVVVAGAGGGGSFLKGSPSGGASSGGSAGQVGTDGTTSGAASPLGGGLGATASAGGAAGTAQGNTGLAGSLGTGGDGPVSTGGGGGSGTYGGGSGSNGGGGGGSSSVTAGASATYGTVTDASSPGAPGANGSIELAYQGDDDCSTNVPLTGGALSLGAVGVATLAGIFMVRRRRDTVAG